MTALLLASGIGVLTASGVWLLLRARTFDVPLGLTLLSYAVNLFIFAMGRIAVGASPIVRPGVPATLAHYADPLPQALVLTAIVISFAMTGVVLALALKACLVKGSDLCDAPAAGEAPARGGAPADAVARGEAATVPDGLLHMADQAGRIFRDARGQLPMFLEFWTQASQHPEFWQETVAPYRSYQSSFAALIEAGIAEGSLRPVNAAVASRAIVAVAVGVLLQGLLDPQGADWGKVMTESMRMMLEGLGVRC
jgi:multicomponent K+:H+ antiporter subunit C